MFYLEVFEARIVEGGATLSILANKSRFTLNWFLFYLLLLFGEIMTTNSLRGRLLLIVSLIMIRN